MPTVHPPFASAGFPLHRPVVSGVEAEFPGVRVASSPRRLSNRPQWETWSPPRLWIETENYRRGRLGARRRSSEPGRGTAERRAPGCLWDFVGILTTAGGAYVMEKPSLPALPQVRGLTARTSLVGGTGLEPVTCRL